MRLPDLKVSLDLAPQAHVLGNATDLKRVIGNLIENARRYGRAEDSEFTEIDISCHLKGMHGARRVVVEVSDHGPGVPAGQLDAMLKPFTRLDSARSQANGAGLGLAIVERVLKRHGAELQLNNRDGGGLVIRFSMPAA
jgi:two-component system osmolarity sensor histidine kinase EnvZ